MADLKFCPKCGAERVEGVQKCSCGYEYPKKGLHGCVIALIVVVVLFPILLCFFGVIAALTIPTLVNRQSDLAAQVRLKKAISSYEDVAAVYMAEKEKKNLAYAFGSNCDGIDEYFRAVDRQGCNFTTVDGVYWEIDPNTGYAAITDKQYDPLYGVVMWAENETVNNERKIPKNLKMPSTEPIHCTFYPRTFAESTPTQLREMCKK